MPLSHSEFTERLIASGLMSEGEIAEFQQRLPADKQPRDAQALANELVRRKRLTEYQAREIYAGRTKGLVLGEYVILEKIGTGGMGQVFKGEHRRMARQVAIKILAANLVGSPQAVQRFEREVRAAARLEHPNIVTAHDAGKVDETHFLVLQYVDGRDLKTLVQKHGPLPVETAVHYIAQAGLGLDHAHLLGIVHRDMKPANLLVDKKGTVRVLDMGLARLEEELKADSRDSGTQRLTLRDQVLGTTDFMSPEQAADTRQADARSDIYSLGCTLHFLLTGRPPYVGATPTETIVKHHDAPVPSLRTLRPDVPQVVDEIFQRMLAKNPDERYQSMDDLLTAVETCGVIAPLRVATPATEIPARPSGMVRAGSGSSVSFRKEGPGSSTPLEFSTNSLGDATPSAGSGNQETQAFSNAGNSTSPEGRPPLAVPQRGVPWAWLIGGMLIGGTFFGALVWFLTR